MMPSLQEITPRQKSLAKARALARHTRFEHQEEGISGVVRLDETKTKTGLVEVVVLKRQGNYNYSLADVQLRDDGEVDLKGTYMFPAAELRVFPPRAN